LKTNRLEAFSDGVIAIIITIMVLDLRAPHEPTLGALMKLWPVFLSYALSFLIVAIYWVNHHHLIHLVKKVDGCILWANMNLLFWMSLLPFVTAYLGETRGHPMAASLYAAANLAGAGSFSLLRGFIADQNRGNKGDSVDHEKMHRKNMLSIYLYAAAVGTAYLSVPLSLVLVALPALMYFRPEKAIEAKVRETLKTGDTN
jgi:uncharacterized membrane protein